MAEENDNIVEEVTDEVTEQPTEQVEEKQIDESKFNSAGDDSVIKVDLSNPPVQESEEVEQEEPAEEEKVDVVEEPEAEEEIVQEQVEEQPVLQEITEEEEVEEKIEEFVTETKETGKSLPENIQKLMDFMEETGGDLQDYVNLNRDVSKMDDSEILDEYYRATKSHLTPEERSFLLEDSFGYDEDEDDPRDIRKKKIALKEQVAEARAHLDGQKSKYYEDIKAGSKLTEEQQKAIDFFNRHNKESEEQNKISEVNKRKFKQRTENVFNDKFKGFDYKVGDKKFRFNVKDVEGVKTEQSDLSNFINKFVGKDSTIEDAKGYHKSLFTAMNADAIANHFYEQGKADAIKGQVARDKNINTNPRQTHGEFNASGVKFKVLGETSSDMKNRSFKIRKKN
jgi:hypothetical protein